MLRKYLLKKTALIDEDGHKVYVEDLKKKTDLGNASIDDLEELISECQKEQKDFNSRLDQYISDYNADKEVMQTEIDLLKNNDKCNCAEAIENHEERINTLEQNTSSGGTSSGETCNCGETLAEQNIRLSTIENNIKNEINNQITLNTSAIDVVESEINELNNRVTNLENNVETPACNCEDALAEMQDRIDNNLLKEKHSTYDFTTYKPSSAPQPTKFIPTVKTSTTDINTHVDNLHIADYKIATELSNVMQRVVALESNTSGDGTGTSGDSCNCQDTYGEFIKGLIHGAQNMPETVDITDRLNYEGGKEAATYFNTQGGIGTTDVQEIAENEARQLMNEEIYPIIQENYATKHEISEFGTAVFSKTEVAGQLMTVENNPENFLNISDFSTKTIDSFEVIRYVLNVLIHRIELLEQNGVSNSEPTTTTPAFTSQRMDGIALTLQRTYEGITNNPTNHATVENIVETGYSTYNTQNEFNAEVANQISNLARAIKKLLDNNNVCLPECEYKHATENTIL